MQQPATVLDSPEEQPRSLRQVDEPPPSLPISPPHADDKRRLSYDFLVGLARSASDASTLNAVPSVQHHCRKELRSVCATPVRVAQSVFDSTHGGNDDPHKLVAALRDVHECLLVHSESLSMPCLDTLLTNFLNQTPTPTPTPTQTPTHTPTPTPWPTTEDGRPRVKTATEDDHYKVRHQHYQDKDRDSDSVDEWRGAKRNDGVTVYVINNGGAPPIQAGALGYWGDRPRHDHHRFHDDGGLHPIAWLLILPFFCVGLYVSAKHAVAFVKKRRGSLPFATTSQQEYVPLKAPDSAE